MRIGNMIDEIIDFNKIADRSLILESIYIHSLKEVKKLILVGTIEKCEFEFVENLELLDLTKVGLLHYNDFRLAFCKKNGLCRITEAQKNFPSSLSKFRWKKEVVPSTTEEIDHLVSIYHNWQHEWGHGYKFFKWVVKQPICDKGTALQIYWKGNPEWFTQFGSKNEIDDDDAKKQFMLLTSIEKRVKKGDFATNQFKFDIDQYLKRRPIEYPENKVREIPDFMFSNSEY